MNEKQIYNIAILNHHASAPDIGGGGRHYELAKTLSENGHKTTVIASLYPRGKNSNYSKEITIKQFNENFDFVYLKTKPAYKNTITRFINYVDYMIKASKFREFIHKPNIIIASSVHPLAWVAGYKLSKRYNAKFIVEVRDLWPLSMYEDFSGVIRSIVFNYFEGLERKYYNLADAIITTAPYAFEYMEEKYGIDRNKVFHIPHGIDIDEFDKNANKDGEILNSELQYVLNNNVCITYTGSLSKSEGLSTFVEAAKYLRDIKEIKLVIVGSGSERSKLDAMIKEENLSNVIMVERQPKELIPLILKKSAILFCGLRERKVFKYGISKNKFYDYMASGKPIIFASSVRDSLIDKVQAGITIKPHEPENLAKAIKHIYENIDTLGKQYGQNGRRYVEEHHTNVKIAEQFMDVIDFAWKKTGIN